MEQILQALKFMGIGMLGIFLVMTAIFLFVLVLNNWKRIWHFKQRDDKQSPDGRQDGEQ